MRETIENINIIKEENNEMFIRLEELKLSIDHEILTLQQLKEEIAVGNTKVFVIENQAIKENESFEAQLQNLVLENKAIEEETENEIKELIEVMNSSKSKLGEEIESNVNNYRELIQSLEQQVQTLSSRKTDILKNIDDKSLSLKNLSLECDILTKNIKVSKQIKKSETHIKSDRHKLNQTFPLARKRSLDDFSDSSVEGRSHSTEQLLRYRKHKKGH